MSKIDEMINSLCPDGVEYKKLGELGTFDNIGIDKKIVEGEKSVTILNYMDVYHYKRIDKNVPKMIVTASDKKIEQCTVQKGDIFITPTSETRDDIGHASVITETIPNACYSYHIMRYRLNSINMTTSYFICYLFESHDLRKQILKYSKGLTRFGLSKYDFAKIEIPVPPIEIQQEIVRILDNFTNLTAELQEKLQAELQARKEQYEYYRNNLLTFDKDNDDVKWMKMGDIAKFTYGYTDKAKSEGDLRFIRISDILDNGCLNSEDAKFVSSSKDTDSYLLKKGDLLMARTGATFGKTLYVESDKPAVYASFLIKITLPSDLINSRYYWYISKSSLYWIQANKYVSRGGQQQFNANALGRVQIPIPPLSEQERIVSILDKFEVLVNDLTSGLPAEIAALQEQYEYYRNKLLTFEKAV